MRTQTPVTVHRTDYAPPDWRVPRTRLRVELAPEATRVTCTLSFERNADGPDGPDGKRSAAGESPGGETPPLRLDGTNATGGPLVLESVALDGRPLERGEYVQGEETLVIEALPARGELTLVTVVNPDANTALEGLYRSSGNYCTQCEAEGFRKITYHLDRPDVLSVFDVTLIAPRISCPVLLSNGNLLGEEDLGDGRHAAHWHDPHPKPCYLFALVAGDLASIEDRFVTRSGREVALHVFSEAHNIGKCDFAMASLKASMAWDEAVYGFEYDLERFTIVAVDDFNMGAMENKGLNVFNTKYVLADADSATDEDYLGIEAVVAHEYFHNWTGNRITCRDWFQLSLKEGLTVFRDQSFTADRHSATVKRIEDVRLLRARQFPEDASPMAHPIRPDSYVEINNFYTLTVYEKGAEVIRMLHTLLGETLWRAGMDEYVARHDGEAATCEQFVAAMEAASGVDLAQFRLWYSTAGTPELHVEEHFDAARSRYTLSVRQSVPDTPGQSDKPPLHIPFRVALLAADGTPLVLDAGRDDGAGGRLLELREREERVVVENVATRPIASLLRGFSAPVKLHREVDDATLAFLMANDTDPFNRWEAGQTLATRAIEACLAARGDGVGRDADAPRNGLDEGRDDPEGRARDTDEPAAVTALIEALGRCLEDVSLEPAFRSEVLSLPSLDTLAETRESIDMPALDAARRQVLEALARRWQAPLTALASAPSRPSDPADGQAMGARRLANVALALLGALGEEVAGPIATRRFESAANMSDRIAALRLLCHGGEAYRAAPLAAFHERWRGDRLVIDKWFAVQATADRPAVIDDVERLLSHPDFEIVNPNRARSLIAGFAFANPARFHGGGARAYRLLADQVMRVEPLNPQLAASLLAPLGRWRRFVPRDARAMRAELERIRDAGPSSPDVLEIVTKSLGEAVPARM